MKVKYKSKDIDGLCAKENAINSIKRIRVRKKVVKITDKRYAEFYNYRVVFPRGKYQEIYGHGNRRKLMYFRAIDLWWDRMCELENLRESQANGDHNGL